MESCRFKALLTFSLFTLIIQLTLSGNDKMFVIQGGRRFKLIMHCPTWVNLAKVEINSAEKSAFRATDQVYYTLFTS